MGTRAFGGDRTRGRHASGAARDEKAKMARRRVRAVLAASWLLAAPACVADGVTDDVAPRGDEPGTAATSGGFDAGAQGASDERADGGRANDGSLARHEDGVVAPLPDRSLRDAGSLHDAATDAANGTGGGTPNASCAEGSLVLVAGSTAGAYGITNTGRPSNSSASLGWRVRALRDGAASPPSLVRVDGGTVAAYRTPSGGVGVARFHGAWSEPTPFASSTLRVRGRPMLAADDASLSLVVHGDDYKFYEASGAGGGDRFSPFAVVGPAGTPSFGPSGPSAIVDSATLVVVQGGEDGRLYEQTRTASGWQAATALGADIDNAITPAAVRLAVDARLIVFTPRARRALRFARRERTGVTFGDVPGASSGDPAKLAAVSTGAILGFRGEDGRAYASRFDRALGTFAPPLPLAPSVRVTTAPAVSGPACGALAFAAFVSAAPGGIADAAGGLFVSQLTNEGWSAPERIPLPAAVDVVAIIEAEASAR
jgi:hypothetical protein